LIVNNKNNLASLQKFLKINNINFLSLERIQNDASKRHYYRIRNHKKKILVMDSSLEKASLEKFIKISFWLKENGFSCPNIYNFDIKSGFLLLEDFGENKYSKIIKKKKVYYYKKAIDLLISLSKKKPPKFLKKYSNEILHEELSLYLIWFLKLKNNKNNKTIVEWIKKWDLLFKKINYHKYCLVLRDFHVDNIFYLKKRIGNKKVGLIDFQDGLKGHIAYDIVSLLQDVRVFLSEYHQKELLNYYIKIMKVDRDEFEYAYLVLGTQRLFKIIGIFNRLAVDQNKFHYLRYIPRTERLLNKNLKNPVFNKLNKWLKKTSNNEK
jgi:aminoglycoside/choline kinase family phosphotransferase